MDDRITVSYVEEFSDGVGALFRVGSISHGVLTSRKGSADDIARAIIKNLMDKLYDGRR